MIKIKKLLKKIFSQVVLVGFLLLLQILVLVIGIWKLSRYFAYIYAGLSLLSLVVLVRIMNKKDNPSYKLAWAIPIALVPVFGGLFYLIIGTQNVRRKFRRRLARVKKDTAPYLNQGQKTLEELADQNAYCANMAAYLAGTGCPVYQNTQVTYFPSGEAQWETMLAELRQAKRYIFLEYFIIDSGKMWDSILGILKEKAAQGVDVRLLYDGMGCLTSLKSSFPKKLREFGIQCRVFRPFSPFLSALQNNRDHRKICVIDGHTAFNGGTNLADEYINVTHKFGYWKDSAVMLKGEAAYSFALMFLHLWNVPYPEEDDYGRYRALPEEIPPRPGEGFVLPYASEPDHFESNGEFVYMDIITKARHSLYITTPYLCLDNELVTALGNAAKCGVDVKIIVPSITDHWYADSAAQSYYLELMTDGVEIYSFTPGFIHAKNVICDDEIAVVGTVNWDYRSLYLHFECGTWMYKTPALKDIFTDFEETLKKCRRINTSDITGQRWPRRLLNSIMRIFAPLM